MKNWSELAGRVLMVGLPGTELDPETEQSLRALRPAGVILFGRNLDSPQQTALLLERVASLLPGPGLLAIDQEGGRVSRLEPWLGATPTANTLSTAGAAAVSRFGQLTGELLGALGFNLDFAPVVDLCPPATPNGIGDRSFGTDPSVVERMAGSFLDGLQRTGVAGCLKHFPGLGHTTVDSHQQLPTVTRSRAQLEAVELAPYAKLCSRAASVMVGHGHYPAWDQADQRAACCSPRIVTGLLRERLRFGGLIVSDDLEMGAVAELDRGGELAVEVLRAGCDLLLYCSDLERAQSAQAALAAAAGGDPQIANRLREATRSIELVEKDWAPPRPRSGGWEERLAAFREFLRQFPGL